MTAEYSPFVLRKSGTFVDRTGHRYERLVAIRPMRKAGKGGAYWECKCDCGRTIVVRGDQLVEGQKSCGCQKDEVARELLPILGRPYRIQARHGHAKHSQTHTSTPTYHSWNGLKQRCSNPRDDRYKYYGARGITYEQRWESFDNFLEDMGEAPVGYHIGRIDGDGPYCKANCRWESPRQNMNNRRNTRFVEYRGERISVADLARMAGLGYMTLRVRLDKGWSISAAVETPLHAGRNRGR